MSNANASGIATTAVQAVQSAPVDEVLKQKLVDYMGSLEGAVKQGTDFAMEQAPAVAREIVAYNLAYGISVALLIWAAIIPIVFAQWALTKHLERTKESGEETACVLGLVFGVIFQIIFFFVGLSYLSTILQCWFAPRYFIIQEILRMTAGH